MNEKCTEFSFVLKPAKYGVGVFATHDIKKGTYLRLFGDTDTSVTRNKNDVPELFQQYCVSRGKVLYCPKDFGHMELGWYMNHSKTPNAHHKDYGYYALKDIKAEEEITVDYNTLGEPEEDKENYYRY